MNSDSTLKLNKETNLGSVQEPEKLIAALAEIFRARAENRVYAENSATDAALSEAEKIERTVFIKAPRAADYGSVAKVIDAVKTAGANPISLQIDDLD